MSVSALVGLACSLSLPVYALISQAVAVDWRLLFGVPCVASVTAYVVYRIDKQRAEAGEWRISESTLHAIEVCGGWPGAFLAQRRFRHKISKPSYQVTFWLIVALHHLLALDSLVGWRYAKMLINTAN